jgi:hypothetical protein
MTRVPCSGKPLGRLARGLALIGLACCAGVASRGVSAPMLMAQTQTDRVVQGKVLDKSDAAVKGATVFLKDGHTLAVKSYIASDDGSYRFGQLAQNTDYQLWAESDGKKSTVKSISSFDTRNQININLKIEK